MGFDFELRNVGGCSRSNVNRQRPRSPSDTAGNTDRPADKASRLAASEVINAVLPDLANPVIPMRIVLRSCSTSAARRLALPTASFSTRTGPAAESGIGNHLLEALVQTKRVARLC
jgi:hypothetical protein